MSLLIDAGHGGTDPGAMGNGIREEDFNLKTALYIYNRAKALGIKCGITRTSDITLDPPNRAKLVKNSGFKHCLSCHVNAGGGDGAEFIHSKFASDKWAQLMKKNILAAGQNVRRIFTRTLNSGADYYYMHRETGSVETVIFEMGFADNRLDAEQIKANQYKYAEAALKGYCEYIGHPYKAPGTATAAAAKGLWKVQAGAFRDKDNAEQRAAALRSKGFEAALIFERD